MTTAQLKRLAAQYARQAGINPRIFRRQIRAESGWNPSAVSHADARGIAQIVPRWHPDVDPTRPGNQLPGVNPAVDLRYAANLMASHLRKYGSIRDALSAYNSGRPWSEGQNIAETRGYVEKILGGLGGGGGGGRPRPRLAAPAMPGLAGPVGGGDAALALSLLSAGRQRRGESSSTFDLLSRFLASSQEAISAPGGSRMLPGGPGGAPGAPGGRGGGLIAPLGTPMPRNSEYRVRDPEGADGFHSALDWFAPAGATVRAPRGGRIVEVKQSTGNSGQVFGGVVKVQAPNGRVFVFRHVDPLGLKVGQRVKGGTPIARVSPWTGGSPHAHIEVWKTLAGGYSHSNMLDPLLVFGGRR